MAMDEKHDRNLDYAHHASVMDVHSSVRREKSEPSTGMEPVSLWSFIGAGLVMAAGGAYLGAYSGGGLDMDNVYAVANYVPEERPILEGVEEVIDNRPWIEKWMSGGKQVYATCQACHQPNGNGMPGQFPPLAGSDWVTGGTERLAAIVFPGISGPITVNGATYNGIMPPQGAMLSDKQIAQVMTYIRRSFGNNASVVTEEMVRHARELHGSRTTPWTESELNAIGPDKMLPGAEVDLQTGEPIGGGGGNDAPTDAPPAEA